MWTFLVTEILFFGGLFAAYTLYRYNFPSAFRAGSHELDITLGCFNTVVIIASSLTMALAVRGGQMGKGKLAAVFLVLTLILGSVFLVVKAFEYHDKFVHHHVPGPTFHFEGAEANHVQMFFSLYFAMTGLHALHMIIGIVLVGYVATRAAAGVFAALMALTALTVSAAFVNLGPANNFVALAIAVVKSTLVILFFMHVKGNTKLVPVVILSGVFFLLVLFVFLAADYGTRGWLGVPGR